MRHSNIYALKRKTESFWVDAICIDQENVEERRHQVQRMSYIYREAEQVVIWLGEGTKDSDLIMDAMKRLQTNKAKLEGDWRRSARLWMHSQPGSGDIIAHEYAEFQKAMELILRRPWFRRIWILQEIANAQVATIVCGKKSVSARIFAQVPSILELQPELHPQAVLDIMPGLSRKESWWGQDRNLHTLLMKFRGSEATDERDIIYALLGISSDEHIHNILIPDYTKSLQQVIRDTVSFLLFHTVQARSLYHFLNWTLSEFLGSLDLLGNAVLRSAIEHGQEVMVELLLAINSVELDLKDRYGRTPLSWAALSGHKVIVQLLLEKGAKLESEDENGKTPLLWAVSNKRKVIVQLLLEKGARLDSEDKNGRTPLSWAASSGHKAIVQLLLEKRARLESEDAYGRTPLSWAALSGHKAIVKLLLQEGAKIETEDKNRRTPSSWATEHT